MGGRDECLAGRESYQDSSATSLLPSSESKLKSPLNIQMCPFRVNPADMNEPYYRDYLATDLGAIAQEAGLECGMKVCVHAPLFTSIIGSSHLLNHGSVGAYVGEWVARGRGQNRAARDVAQRRIEDTTPPTPTHLHAHCRWWALPPRHCRSPSPCPSPPQLLPLM